MLLVKGFMIDLIYKNKVIAIIVTVNLVSENSWVHQ